MASVLGVLEGREVAARVRVEGLREEAARLAQVLEAAGIELGRRMIAREALAVSAAGTTAVTEAERETACSPLPVQGSTVPPWRDGLPVTVLPPDYQRILGVRKERRSATRGMVLFLFGAPLLVLFTLSIVLAVVGEHALLLGRMPGRWLQQRVRQPRLWGAGAMLMLQSWNFHSLSLLAVGIGLVALGHVLKPMQ